MAISKRKQFQLNNVLSASMSGKTVLGKSRQISGFLRGPLAGIRKLFFLGIFILGSSFSASSQSTVKIGFLIRDQGDLAIQLAAELAIKKANANGGYQGQNFELVTRSCDGPWGITSKQAVELIHEQEVPILVTALDGRNAHLAEQVVAKSHVVMLSTLSSDPTLSRAYVPWYYRIIPDDRQQAVKLVNDIYKAKKYQKVVVLALDNYDGQKSAEAFVDEVRKFGLPVPEMIRVARQDEWTKAFNQDQYESIVIAGTPGFALDVEDFPSSVSVYAFLNCFNFVDVGHFPDDVKTIRTLSSAKDTSYDQGTSESNLNSPSHAYVYDGILLAVEAIRKFGSDPDIIRKAFGDLTYEGITGTIQFDSMGNRKPE